MDRPVRTAGKGITTTSVSGFTGSPAARPPRGLLPPPPQPVEVLVHPLPGLGVVVVEVERMRLGLAQEVHDLAGLAGPLLEAGGETGGAPRGGGLLRAERAGRQ